MDKELKITPPEGYEIDKENSAFECIKFKKKSLTYEDVAKELFVKGTFYINSFNQIVQGPVSNTYMADPFNVTSEKQLKKLLAINKLMNVAKYLNGDWKPDWSDGEEKWSISIVNNSIRALYTCGTHNISAYFKTEDLAQQAIDILGEETIRLALSTDW